VNEQRHDGQHNAAVRVVAGVDDASIGIDQPTLQN